MSFSLSSCCTKKEATTNSSGESVRVMNDTTSSLSITDIISTVIDSSFTVVDDIVIEYQPADSLAPGATPTPRIIRIGQITTSSAEERSTAARTIDSVNNASSVLAMATTQTATETKSERRNSRSFLLIVIVGLPLALVIARALINRNN